MSRAVRRRRRRNESEKHRFNCEVSRRNRAKESTLDFDNYTDNTPPPCYIACKGRMRVTVERTCLDPYTCKVNFYLRCKFHRFATRAALYWFTDEYNEALAKPYDAKVHMAEYVDIDE